MNIASGLALVAAGSLAGAFGVIPAWAVLAGLGLGGASVAATTLGTRAPSDRGTAAGVLSTAAQAGTALGVATLTSFLAVAALSAAAAALALSRRAPSLGADQHAALSHGSSSDGS